MKRIVKVIKDGVTTYRPQKKFLFWWRSYYYVDGCYDGLPVSGIYEFDSIEKAEDFLETH